MAALIIMYLTIVSDATNLSTGAAIQPREFASGEILNINNPWTSSGSGRDGTSQSLSTPQPQQHELLYERDAVDDRAIVSHSTSISLARASIPRTENHKMPNLQRRGGCMSISCFEDPDSQLMKVPLPNPRLARTSSEARIVESPFSKVHGKPISRSLVNINQELNRQYTVFERTNSDNWMPGMSRAEPVSSSDLSQDLVDRAKKTIDLERYKDLPTQPKSRYASPRRRMGVTEPRKPRPRYSAPVSIPEKQSSGSSVPARSPKAGGLPVTVNVVDNSKIKPNPAGSSLPSRLNELGPALQHAPTRQRAPELGTLVRADSTKRRSEGRRGASSSKSPKT